MPNGVTLITCTGGRPESLARCSSFVARFENPDRLPVQWIVIDDVADASRPRLDRPILSNVSMSYVRPKHVWSPGGNTLALNLLEAIPLVQYDAVMFVEDDDYYKPDYMISQLARLADHEMSGESVSRYYNLPTSRWRVMENVNYASLCQTAMRDTMLPALALICRSRPDFIDYRLWKVRTLNRFVLELSDPLVVGMKGLPGRPGIGIGHRPEHGSWNADPGRKKLREWLGADADLYVGPETAS